MSIFFFIIRLWYISSFAPARHLEVKVLGKQREVVHAFSKLSQLFFHFLVHYNLLYYLLLKFLFLKLRLNVLFRPEVAALYFV